MPRFKTKYLLEPVSIFIGLSALLEGALGAGALLGISGLTASAIGGAIVSFGIVAGLSAVNSTLTKSAARKASAAAAAAFSSQAAEYRTPVRSGVSPRLLLLGEGVKSGQILFEETKGAFYYLMLGLTPYEIDGFNGVRNGSQKLPLDVDGYPTQPPYRTATKTYMQFSLRRGTRDQTVDRIIAQDWSIEKGVNFRQQETATMVMKAFRGENATEAAEIWGDESLAPLVEYRGSRVFDPRDPTQNPYDSDTHKFTRNAALNYAHWRTHPDFGRTAWADIDLEALAKAADICDQMVLRADGSREPLYCIDGIISTTEDIAQVENALLLSFLGTRLDVEGKIVIQAGAPVPEDEWRTCDEDTMRGTVQASRIPAWRDVLNTVRTTYASRDAEYAVTDGPVYRSQEFIDALEQYEADLATWYELDNWRIDPPRRPEEKSIDVVLQYVSSPRQVQYIAFHLIKRSEFGATIRRGADITMFRQLPGDIIREVYDSGELNELSGVYELKRISDSDRKDEFEVELLEYSPDLYAFPGEQ